MNEFPCRIEVDTGCSIDLVEIGQLAGATRDQLVYLTMWLATSIRSGRQDDVAMVPADGLLTWAPVLLSRDNIDFDTSGLGAEVQMHGTTKDSLTKMAGTDAFYLFHPLLVGRRATLSLAPTGSRATTARLCESRQMSQSVLSCTAVCRLWSAESCPQAHSGRLILAEGARDHM
jgi:hypothetical protein